MAATRKIDMTKGYILKAVLLFAIPICIGDMLQQFHLFRGTFIGTGSGKCPGNQLYGSLFHCYQADGTL